MYQGLHVNMTCKQWGCPVCGKRNLNVLMRRLWAGHLYSEAKRLWEKGVRYHVKFLTLTLPGQEYRMSTSVEEAVEEISMNWNRLLSALRQSKYKGFEYFAVVESQRDGYAHLHVLLCGEGVVGKGILAYIRGLWCGRYGMGFVKLNARRRVFDRVTREYHFEELVEPNAVVGYMVKYMSKGLVQPKKWTNVYRSSRGALGGLDDIELDNSVVVAVQMSGFTVQEERLGYEGDSVEVFRVRGQEGLNSVVWDFFDRDAPFFNGSVDREVRARLVGLYGELRWMPGERIRKEKRKKGGGRVHAERGPGAVGGFDCPF